MNLGIGDRRALANLIAQKILKGNTLEQVDGEMPMGPNGGRKYFHNFSEQEVTNMVAEQINEFFGEVSQ